MRSPIHLFNEWRNALRALDPGPTKALATCARLALCIAWAAAAVLELTMCIPAAVRLLAPEVARGFMRLTGAPTVPLVAAIVVVAASAVVWAANRKRVRVLQRMALTRACFECGYPQSQCAESCAECGAHPVAHVRVSAPDRWVPVVRMGKADAMRLLRAVRRGTLAQDALPVVGGVLVALLLAIPVCMVLAVLAGNPLPVMVYAGPLWPLIFLGMLTVKHMELRPVRASPLG